MTTHVLVDVCRVGHPQSRPFRGRATLERLFDSRVRGARVEPPEVIRVEVPATDGHRPDAASVNLTATNAAGVGYVSAYPCDAVRPETSVLNYRAGVDIANHVFVDLDDSGAFCLWSSVAAHLIVDLDGAFSDDPGATTLVTHAAARVADTRSGHGGRLSPRGAPRVFDLGEPSNGVLAQITIVGPARPGYVSIFPCDDPGAAERTSVLNAVPGDNAANVVLMRNRRRGTPLRTRRRRRSL
ncbi:MAG: hypothetical protein R2705_23470 [Ilumatobacteraceae bacterium]